MKVVSVCMQANSSKVSVRRATEDDATFLAWVLLEASRSSLPRGFYDVLFDDCGEGELLAILKDLVLTSEPSFTRWDSFLIAEIDGIHAGAACGYGAEEKTGEGLWRAVTTALKERKWSAEQMAKVERVWNELLVLWPALNGEHEHWIVEYVAVAPTFRKRGVCHQLMLAVLDQGRARGFKRAQITPYADNEASVRAYEKVGFKEYCTITSPIFEQHIPDTLGALHMRMEL